MTIPIGVTSIGDCAFEECNLLIENNITFPNLRSSADIIWTLKLFFYAKKFLRIPDPLYVYRNNTTSITRSKRTFQQDIIFWMDINISGMKILNSWFNQEKFFQENPQCKWNLLDMFEQVHLNGMVNSFQKLSPFENYKVLENVFEEKFGEYGAEIAYLCTSSNFAHLKEIILTQRIMKLENKLKQLQGG